MSEPLPWACDVCGVPLAPGSEHWIGAPVDTDRLGDYSLCGEHRDIDPETALSCSVCGRLIPEDAPRSWKVPPTGSPLGDSVVTCGECTETVLEVAEATDGPDLEVHDLTDGGPTGAEALQGLIVSAEAGPGGALRVKAAAELLGCSDRRVRDFITEGRLEAIPGKPLRVTRASVDALIADRAERGVTPSNEITPSGGPTGAPTGETRQVLDALAVLAAEVADLRAQLEARPALEAPPPKRWGLFTRREPNRATVPTNDAAAAVDSLRQHYTAEQIRAALGDPE